MDKIIITDPFVYDILSYLRPVDLLTLKFASWTFYKKIDKKIFYNFVARIMNNRLSHIFGDRLIEFKNIMESTKCVISGSFIIQSILGEQWDGSDIDIYVTGQKIPLTIEFFLHNTMNFTLRTLLDNTYIKEGDKLKITSIKDFQTFENKRIQIICINTDNSYNSVKNYIHETYDYDICKNLYYVDKTEHLSIYHPNDIYNKKINYDLNQENSKNNILIRYKKYRNRGFKIIVNNCDFSKTYMYRFASAF